jgi:hypothetical protein
MKKLIPSLLLVFAIYSCETKKETSSDTAAIAPELNAITAIKIWETDTIFKTPESVLYDKENDLLYVANIGNVPPTNKDSDGFISKLSTSGELIELNWITDLHAAKGMGKIGNRLFVTNIDEVVEIDIRAGIIINRFAVDSAIFLNDITVADDSTIFISDTGTNKIHTLKNGAVSTWLQSEKLGNPNGLLYQENKLMLATYGSNEYSAIDMNTKALTLLADSLQGGDGVVAYGEDYIVSGWNGVVFHITSTGTKTLLIDTKADPKNAADIEIISETKIVLVPTFFGNTVAAYAVK